MKPQPDHNDSQRPDDPANQTADQDLDAGRRVLRLEAEGLNALANSLGGEFSRVLDLLAAVSGRITVTGMGKSGHVARKIAATLASTGSPAQFVHPGEASHGDLGMIAPGDAVLAISNLSAIPLMRATIGIIIAGYAYSIVGPGMACRIISSICSR